MVFRSVSLWDLMNYEESKKAALSGDRKQLEDILFKLGLDVAKGYEEEQILHRPLSKKDKEPWFGIRYSSFERQDFEWLNSEHCSWENKLDNTDVSLRDDLISLGQQSNFTDSIIQHISGGQKGEEV